MKLCTLRPGCRPLRLAGIFSLAASALFFWLWYEFYLRIEFNEQGRYHDPETHMVYSDSAFAWLLPAIGFLIVAVASFARHRRRRPTSVPPQE